MLPPSRRVIERGMPCDTARARAPRGVFDANIVFLCDAETARAAPELSRRIDVSACQSAHARDADDYVITPRLPPPSLITLPPPRRRCRQRC